GNPRMLALLYENNWSIEGTVNELIKFKDIDQGFVKRWRNQLEKAVEDPDYLWFEAPRELVNKLIAKNLIIYNMYDRDLQFWIDEPPPIRDPELGIGKYVAWQTPLHREAVRRALEVLR
ncbi:MAG: ATP-binding protein, partial [Vulcanisaeta sp.]